MNFFMDHAKPFYLTLGRYLRKRSRNAVRWSMRSPKHLLVSVALVILLAVGIHNASGLFEEEASQRATTTAQTQTGQDDGLTWREVEASPLGSSASPSEGSSASASPSESTKAIEKPTADRGNRASTARAFATAFVSREEGQSQWEDWSAELTNEQLADQLQDIDAPFVGRGNSTASNIEISKEPFAGAPKDTPLRWSRTLDVTVDTEQGADMKVTYEITLMRGEGGWEVTDAVERGWTAAHDEG